MCVCVVCVYGRTRTRTQEKNNLSNPWIRTWIRTRTGYLAKILRRRKHLGRRVVNIIYSDITPHCHVLMKKIGFPSSSWIHFSIDFYHWKMPFLPWQPSNWFRRASFFTRSFVRPFFWTSKLKCFDFSSKPAFSSIYFPNHSIIPNSQIVLYKLWLPYKKENNRSPISGPLFPPLFQILKQKFML